MKKISQAKLNNAEYTILGCSVKGEGKELNQDSFIVYNNDSCIICLIADGLGAAINAEIGSETICKVAKELILKQGITNDFPNLLKKKWVETLDVKPMSCDTTFKFFVVDKESIIFGGIGDGWIVGIVDEQFFEHKNINHFSNQTDSRGKYPRSNYKPRIMEQGSRSGKICKPRQENQTRLYASVVGISILRRFCGGKMKLNYIKRNGVLEYSFNCGNHMRLGKAYCFSHYIAAKVLEEIIITDIREKASLVVFDEEAVRRKIAERSAELADNADKNAKRELQSKKARATELKKLIEMAYEDRMKGKLPEDVCIRFIEKYSSEEKSLTAEIAELEQRIAEAKQTEVNVDEFLSKIKHYVEAPELTREMCYELIDKVVVGGHPKVTGKDRVINIVYKVDINSIR